MTESIYTAYCCIRCLHNAYNLQNQSVCTPFLSARQLARPHNLTHSLYTVEWSSLISSLSFSSSGKPTTFLQKGSLQLTYRREAYSFLTEGKPTAFLQKGSLQLSYRKEAYNFLTEAKFPQVQRNLQLFFIESELPKFWEAYNSFFIFFIEAKLSKLREVSNFLIEAELPKFREVYNSLVEAEFPRVQGSRQLSL